MRFRSPPPDAKPLPMISVAMPVFNSTATISDALSCLLSSPHVGEVLVADGGSTDGTPDLVERIDDPRLRLVSRSDTGIYNGANTALKACSGEFVLFMNSNDFLVPAYLDAVLAADAREGADFYYGCTTTENREIRPRLGAQGVSDRAWQVMPFPHVSMIVRRSVHESVGWYDESFRIAADLDFINRLLLSGARGSFVDAVAADCSQGGISSGFRHITEACRVAVKNGKPPLSAAMYAAAIAAYRVFRR